MRYTCFIALVVIVLGATISLAEDPTDTGYNIGTQVQDKWGNPEALNQKLAKPLLTGAVPLSTLDESRSGTAQIACPGAQTVFEILVQPSATNDLQLVSVTYDTDLDGTFDGTLSISDPTFVSGVCANGFISCTPGTWDDCTWYKWKFDGALSYEAVPPSSLGGCYCFNTSCTSTPFLLMKDKILQDLGGGIAGAMAAYDPRLSVSKAQIEDLVIRYFGQNTRNCSLSDVVSSYGFPTPEDSYSGSAELSVLTSNEVSSQSSDPDSFYNLLTTSTAATGGSRFNCTLQRSVYFDTSSCHVVDTYTDNCAILDSNPNCSLEEEVVYDVDGNAITTYSHFNPTGVVPVDTCMTLSGADLTSCVIENVGGAGDLPTQFLSCGDFCIDLVIGKLGDNYLSGNCAIYTMTHSLYVKAPEYIESATLRRAVWDDYMQIFINDDFVWCGPDHCTTLPPVDASCERSTSWDWSLNQDLTSYFKIGGKLDVKVNVAVAGYGEAYAYIRIMVKNEEPTICHDWWKIERTYVCTGTPTYDPDVSRADTIAETLTEGTGTWTYTDPVTGTGSVDLNTETGETCIEACKLMVTEDRAQAGAAATTADYRTDPTSVTYIYRTCIDGTCPVNPGETIVKDCQCLNEFDEAVSAMESLRQASKDMICSDGVAK